MGKASEEGQGPSGPVEPMMMMMMMMMMMTMKLKEDEMGVTCGTHRTMQKCIWSFSGET